MKKTQLSKVQKIIQEEFSHIINNKPVNEGKVFVKNEKTGATFEVLSGKGKGDLLIAMKALQAHAPSHMKYFIKESKSTLTESANYIGLGVITKSVRVKDLDSSGVEQTTPRDIVAVYRKDGSSYVVKSADSGNALKVPSTAIKVTLKNSSEWNSTFQSKLDKIRLQSESITESVKYFSDKEIKHLADIIGKKNHSVKHSLMDLIIQFDDGDVTLSQVLGVLDKYKIKYNLNSKKDIDLQNESEKLPEGINENTSYSNKFVLWFIGTVLNTVKHPTQGKHKLTPDQLKNAPGSYKDKLFKAIEVAVKRGDITHDMIRKNS
jgi:hypothetical protein